MRAKLTPTSTEKSPAARHEQWVRQGWTLQKEGRPREAAAFFRNVLRENPRHHEALHSLGLLAKYRGNTKRAEKLIRAAIEAADKKIPSYFNNLANLFRSDPNSTSRELYQKAIELDPDYADALINLASYEELHGNPNLGFEILQRGYERTENLMLAKELSSRLLSQKRFPEALPILKKLAQLEPTDAGHWLRLGFALQDLGQKQAAIEVLIEALRLDPENAGAKITLSQIFVSTAAPQDAEIMLIEAAKKDEQAFAVLGNVYKDLGYIDLALDCYARGLACRPSQSDQSNFLYTLLYDPNQNEAEVAEEHVQWGKTYAQQFRPEKLEFSNQRDPERPLRIGYVAGQFWDHAVAMFSLPMIQAHDLSRFSIFIYNNGSKDDWATQIFRGIASGWHDIEHVPDDEVVQLIRKDEIDILVDLVGHIGGNRLLIFARKPAPIQVTYLGYQTSSGMETMDYRLTDAIADPPGVTDRYYIEKLARLDPSFFVYRPSDYAPPVALPPFEKNGFVTFGCLNNPAKHNEQVVAVWAGILHAIPESRIMLLGPSGQSADPRVAKLFEDHGLGPDRVQFVGKRPRPVYLEQYDRIDIALDPFPFSGHTTTCDALWQGVPVITWAAKTYAGRMSASTLTQARFPQWIAQSHEQYQAIAIQLASDRNALSSLRRNMRDHLRSAPILDAKRFTRSLEKSFCEMWRKWCEQQQSA